jgi:hypothetical protein
VTVLFLLHAQKEKNQKEKGTSDATHDFFIDYIDKKIGLRRAVAGPPRALVFPVSGVII